MDPMEESQILPALTRSLSPSKRRKIDNPEDQFAGFMIGDTSPRNAFFKGKFCPKVFEDHDVDIENECCGVCNSDVQTITGCYLPVTPLCVGHEIIGKVLRVGSKVKGIKPGDRVGVGAQVQSCMKCKNCKSGDENYCPDRVDTYGSPYNHYDFGIDLPKDDMLGKQILSHGGLSSQLVLPMKDRLGTQIFSQGGFCSHSRVHEQFVFPIPDKIPSHEAAPMMCAGLTTYSALVHGGCGPGKKVAILGIGGLGQFGILWAKALDAEVWALSHATAKAETAIQLLGADHFVCCSQSRKWAEPLAFTFDFVLNTVDIINKHNVKEFLSVLAVRGTLHTVGLTNKPLPHFMPHDFTLNGCRITGGHIGGKTEALAMLKLAAEKNVHPLIETIAISDKGCRDAVQKVKTRDVRGCVVLTNFKEAFGIDWVVVAKV